MGPLAGLCNWRRRLHEIKDTYTDWTGFVTGVPGGYEAITKNRSGWTVGGGLQYAVTDNWSVGAEYRYSDFGHYTDYPFTIFTVGDVLTVHII